jgi:hypothetical protein
MWHEKHCRTSGHNLKNIDPLEASPDEPQSLFRRDSESRGYGSLDDPHSRPLRTPALLGSPHADTRSIAPESVHLSFQRSEQVTAWHDVLEPSSGSADVTNAVLITRDWWELTKIKADRDAALYGRE